MYQFKSTFGEFLGDYRGAWFAKKEFQLFRPNKEIDHTMLDYIQSEIQHYKNIDSTTTSQLEKALIELRKNLYSSNKDKALKEFEAQCEKILSQKDMFRGLKEKFLQLHSDYMKAVKETSASNGLRPAQKINNASELVRKPARHGENLPKAYIENSQDVRNHLNNAIDSGSYLESFESYVETMNQAHKLAYAGKSGKNLYYQKDGKNLVMDAGKWRTKTYEHSRPTEIVSDAAHKYADPIEKLFDTELMNVSRESRVKLKGIPEQYQPCDRWIEDAWICDYKHIYTPPEGLELYHREMYRTAQEAVNAIKNKESEDKILEILAEHFQYAANARSYKQINNSLYMNEVNTLLQRAGMRTMPHGELDLYAQRLQPETFKKYFVDTYHKTALPEFGFKSSSFTLEI